MFIQNKYYTWYCNIIQTAQNRPKLTGYFENHHVIPRSLGGTDNLENIVSLTAREHFISHILLTKFTSSDNHHKMLYAVNMMSQISRDYQHRYIPTSRLYEMVKREFSLMHSKRLTGRKLTEEHKAKIGAAGIGRIHSPETIAKRVASNSGKIRTQEQKERMSIAQKERTPYIYTDEEKRIISKKISQANKGKPKSVATKQKLSLANKGKNSGPKSEETKQKMRKPKSEEHRKAISVARIAKYSALRAK